jgi:hypothetical protein
MDELIDIVDENDKVIGQAMKSEAHAKGLLHRQLMLGYIILKGKYYCS